MRNCGQRKLIFSCFDANVCYCLQVKQSTYPVMQLTNGDSGLYVDTRDLRTRRNETAIKWAKYAGFVAINTLVKDVLNGYELVEKCHNVGLKLCVYGDDMQDEDILNRLKDSKLDGICYDLIHQVQ
jgi:glycerophosphocholine phosphodiesterase GPCPD1